MDKVLITYRGGYGDVYSVLTYFNNLKNHKITFLVEKDHVFLKQIFKNVTFVLNPYDNVINDNMYFFKKTIEAHIFHKENVDNFNQDLYDDSIIECAFYKITEFKSYYNFYKKLIDSHDLVITNYLDLTAIKALNDSNIEWWQIRSWNQWRDDLPYVKLLNQKSPYKNIYYYEKDWIKGFPVDESGDYKYRDNDFFFKTIDVNKEAFNLSFKLKKHPKIFFATLGSMSKHNLGIGRNIKYLFSKEIENLFNDDWVGVTTKREYDLFLKNIKNEKFIFLINDWYPHEIIFNYISLFLTHGGAGSFGRAMKHNIKMLVFPFQLDQFFFGQIIQNHYDGKMIR